MKVLSPSAYRMMPWKNGAGTTTEIAVEPPGSDLGGFLWRISIAEVAASAPFSPFPGYDRTILLLAGNGMVLESPEGGQIDLTEPLSPKTFPGEWQVIGELVFGPVRDFNLMVRRACATAHLEVLRLARRQRISCPPGATLAAYVVSGNLSEAPAGHTLIAGHDLDLSPVGGSIVISIAVSPAPLSFPPQAETQTGP